MSRHPIIPFVVVVAMLVVSARASLVTLGCVATGLLVGGLVSGSLAKRSHRRWWWLPPVLVVAAYPAMPWLLGHADSAVAKVFMTMCAVAVGVWSGSSIRLRSRSRFSARDFFLVLALMGAFLGAAFAHDYILLLTLVPASIAFMIGLVPYIRRRFR
jgi:hypothetical protein